MAKKSGEKVIKKEGKTSKNKSLNPSTVRSMVFIKIFLAILVFIICIVHFDDTMPVQGIPRSPLNILISAFLIILSTSLIAWCVNGWKKVSLIFLFWCCFSVLMSVLDNDFLLGCGWEVLISNALLYKASNKTTLKILTILFVLVLIGSCFSKRICRTYNREYGGPNYSGAEEIQNCSVYTLGIKIGEKETKTGAGYHCAAFEDCEIYKRKENKKW